MIFFKLVAVRWSITYLFVLINFAVIRIPIHKYPFDLECSFCICFAIAIAILLFFLYGCFLSMIRLCLLNVASSYILFVYLFDSSIVLNVLVDCCSQCIHLFNMLFQYLFILFIVYNPCFIPLLTYPALTAFSPTIISWCPRVYQFIISDFDVSFLLLVECMWEIKHLSDLWVMQLLLQSMFFKFLHLLPEVISRFKSTSGIWGEFNQIRVMHLFNLIENVVISCSLFCMLVLVQLLF